ncbi:MAG: hypothetical protein MK132_25245 [Lentisphaerales bacterium]|nr:hypothetical protein [Lentisphaerales bacterium]
MKFLGKMSIYQQIIYHRMKNTFGNSSGVASQSKPMPSQPAKPKGSSLLQRDWGRQKGTTHA